MKSERLKKFENELHDLEQWLSLGLVPKKDIAKHKIEIGLLHKKIEEEKQRLQQQKESGDGEEYAVPKRGPQGRQVYQEPQTIPGIESDQEELTETEYESETQSFETEMTVGVEEGKEESTKIDFEDEDPYSDKNRWKRGILEDPESDSW